MIIFGWITSNYAKKWLASMTRSKLDKGPKTDEGTTVPLQSEGYTRNRKTMKPQQPQWE